MSLGAHLHDIGKIGVSEEVLHKPGRLTDEEYAIVVKFFPPLTFAGSQGVLAIVLWPYYLGVTFSSLPH